MRYFQRSGPGVMVQDSNGARWVEGPVQPTDDDPEGKPGGRIAYDDFYPNQRQWADQIAGTPGFFEVDHSGHPIPSPPPKDPAQTPPAQAVGDGPVVTIIAADSPPSDDDEEETPV